MNQNSNNLSVADFRDLIRRCEDNLSQHWNSCVFECEKITWFLSSFRTFNELTNSKCRTAKPEDIDRREIVFDRFSKHFMKHEEIWRKARNEYKII